MEGKMKRILLLSLILRWQIGLLRNQIKGGIDL
jgi:hypothetical protein